MVLRVAVSVSNADAAVRGHWVCHGGRAPLPPGNQRAWAKGHFWHSCTWSVMLFGESTSISTNSRALDLDAQARESSGNASLLPHPPTTWQHMRGNEVDLLSGGVFTLLTLGCHHEARTLGILLWLNPGSCVEAKSPDVSSHLYCSQWVCLSGRPMGCQGLTMGC